VAVVQLGGFNSGDHVVGLIPTGWYPNSVTLSKDGSWAYVVNAKSPTGPNPHWCYTYGPAGYPTCSPANEYNPQLTKAGLQTFQLSSAMAKLSSLTTQVTANNRFSNTSTAGGVMSAVHQGIQHVIYILKENRTYDQILGDLPRGNGDPNLAMFGQAITPNQHKLAEDFVTLDNFRASAEVSNDGWPWSTSARAPDVVEHQYPVNYAQRYYSLGTRQRQDLPPTYTYLRPAGRASTAILFVRRFGPPRESYRTTQVLRRLHLRCWEWLGAAPQASSY
jgi:hypothetical protein